MAQSNVEKAADALFPADGSRRTLNVKFAGGHRRNVTAEELAGQILSADEQIRNGTARRIEDIDGDLTC